MSPLSTSKSWSQVKVDSSKHWEPTPYAGKHLKLSWAIIKQGELQLKEQQKPTSESGSSAITLHTGLRKLIQERGSCSPALTTFWENSNTTRLLKVPYFPQFVDPVGQKRACHSIAMQNCKLMDTPQRNQSCLFGLETSMVMRIWGAWFVILDLGLESV